MIPICDLTIQYQALRAEIDAAMQGVAAEGKYILGPNVKAFEQEMAEYTGAAYAIGVGNGTDALHLALRALDVGPGDEVITTPFTFVATTEAIGLVGATPVFVDIDPDTFNLDAKQVAAAITPRTRGIIPVHLYGQPCALGALRDVALANDLFLVEDCAQALGARYKGQQVGTIGAIGCLSFFPSKNLGCFGDGGMVLTNDRKLYERVEMLRRHGGKVKYHHSELGVNSRLDELQAAILRVKLPHLDRWNDLRRTHACRYNRLLMDVDGVGLPAERMATGNTVPLNPLAPNPRATSVYHQYTIRVENRAAVMESLQAAGVSTMIYYPVPLHLQEVHAHLGWKRGAFPHAEAAAEQCLSLPMFPELTTAQQDHVVAALRQAVAQPRRQAA